MGDEKKLAARIRARDLIYSHISLWVQECIEPGERIPVVRNGETIGGYYGLSAFAESAFQIDPVEDVLSAIDLRSEVELRQQMKRYEALYKASDDWSRAFGDLRSSEMIAVGFTNVEAAKGLMAQTLQGRLVEQLGIVSCASYSLAALRLNIDHEIKSIEAHLNDRESLRGHEKNGSSAGRVR